MPPSTTEIFRFIVREFLVKGLSMTNGFDPTKMDPKVMMQMAELVRQLPPDKISKMQMLMHNMMAGFDVKKDMEEFERSLPQEFREKLVSVMGSSGLGPMGTSSTPPAEMGIRDARVTLLRAVAEGRLTPEDAEKLLFPE
jgi:hypothetical protein